MRLLLPALLALACTPRAPEPTQVPDPVADTEAPEVSSTAAIDLDDPASCAACHGAIVQEWQGSMHSQAHHSRDPIYAAMRDLRMKRQGEGVATKCASCHHPRATQDLESRVAQQGVSCATCHNVSAVDLSDSKSGAAALQVGPPGQVRGPHGATQAAAPHTIGPAAPWMTDGKTLCLACHAAAKNPQGVATCTTGAEHGELEAAASCTSCHMPTVQAASGAASTRESHRSHAFLGPHDLWSSEPSDFMSQAVDLSGSLRGDTVEITLANRTEHGFPSGFPGRVVLVKLVGRDAEGAERWTNFTDDPLGTSPDAVLTKVYVDAEGQPTLPPFAHELARDSRLKPGETRTLRFTGVPAQVSSIDVAVLFRLLPPPGVKALGLTDSPLGEARIADRLRVQRTE